MSEEAMREEVAQAVEVAANKAAEEEISKLTEFESAIDETLASGYLDNTLTVTDADGVAQVLPVLDSEPISHLVEGLEAVGGSANVFVYTTPAKPAPLHTPTITGSAKGFFITA